MLARLVDRLCHYVDTWEGKQKNPAAAPAVANCWTMKQWHHRIEGKSRDHLVDCPTKKSQNIHFDYTSLVQHIVTKTVQSRN